ncbi:MAG: RidA family protein, partial [Opitutae bacterium]
MTAAIEGEGAEVSGRCTADDAIGQVAAVLAQHEIQPIQEKFYGRREVREDVLRHRREAYARYGLDAEVPVTWIEGTPLGGSDFAGLQIWGVASHAGEACVRTVENPVTGRGRVWQGRDFEMLHLPAVRGTLPGGMLPAGPTAQAQQMFTNVEMGLKAHGMAYTDVARTWIYVSRLLEWYGELNRVRNAIYVPAGLGARGGVAFPASTG